MNLNEDYVWYTQSRLAFSLIFLLENLVPFITRKTFFDEDNKNRSKIQIKYFLYCVK